ncbi:glucose-6-phosphate dehydrogenase [Cellulomonas endophytica]|uniref:glucose-6-phosphate dehydrogenase n=1 Tax=Cellulomonas endophytica TaxID=2494735 RepID=UPI001013396F|nr:glucose-6-phosphate dehydrogenase [Cellulomonas endophytica]
MIGRLVVLGATGDLAGRFLLPALARLLAAGGLPPDLRVVGGGHQGWTEAQFRAHVDARLRAHAGDLTGAVREDLVGRLGYGQVDVHDSDGVARLVARAGRGGDASSGPAVAVYLALPAVAFPPALRSLAAVGLPAGSRVAVEKPFGDDRAGAVALDGLLARAAGDDEAARFRVDHILAMPQVEELARLRAPSGPLAPLWGAEHVERVEIVWEETLGLEERGAFYDGTGAVRDVVQNHLLQVLVLALMEPPAGDGDDALHAAKLALLRAVREPTAEQMADRTRRARYGAGVLADEAVPGGRPVPGYAAVAGVDPARATETWAEVVLEVATPRWAGVPVVLRTGKGMGAPRKGVLVHLRHDVDVALPPAVGAPTPRTLWVELDGPGGAVHAPGELVAYASVLTDVLGGGSRTSVTGAEAVEAWRVFEPVLRAWAARVVPLEEYPAGSGGPPAR